MHKYKFGWHGDGGLGERLIQSILIGKKTASVCPAYDPVDADVKEGQEVLLIDKNGGTRGVLRITRVEHRPFAELDETIADCDGLSLADLKDKLHYANSRNIRPEEEMRIVYFELIPTQTPQSKTMVQRLSRWRES